MPVGRIGRYERVLYPAALVHASRRKKKGTGAVADAGASANADGEGEEISTLLGLPMDPEDAARHEQQLVRKPTTLTVISRPS